MRRIFLKKKLNRKFVPITNKYQRKLLTPIILSSCLATFIGILCLLAMHMLETEANNIFNLPRISFKIFVTWFMVGICSIMFFIFLWMYKVIQQMVGPFVRIIRELDEIIEGKRKSLLTVRQDDEMFAELLSRINKLIKH